MRNLPGYKNCFVCGNNNDAGLNMTWMKTDDGVQGTYIAQEKHCSYSGTLHGGIIASLLDECIGWAVSQKEKKMHVTGELTISYKMSVPTGIKLKIVGFCSDEQAEDKTYRNGHGYITDDEGTIYARAKAIFFPIPDAHTETIINMLEIQGTDKRVTIQDLWK